MQVQIQEMSSAVAAVDGDSLLTPQVMERLLRMVLVAIDERDRRTQQIRAEQRVTAGISQEIEEL